MLISLVVSTALLALVVIILGFVVILSGLVRMVAVFLAGFDEVSRFAAVMPERPRRERRSTRACAPAAAAVR